MEQLCHWRGTVKILLGRLEMDWLGGEGESVLLCAPFSCPKTVAVVKEHMLAS